MESQPRHVPSPPKPVCTERLWELSAEFVEVDAALHQYPACDAFTFPQDSEQQVLGVDVVVAKLEAFSKGKLQHFLGLRRERRVTRYVPVRTTHYLSHAVSDLLEADPEGPECPRGEA